MRLSEAIRLGAMLKPQAFGTLWRGVGSCALGAAYDALGCAPFEFPREIERFAAQTIAVCPACESCWGPWPPLSGVAVIGHLNDDHRWTREQIADWVARVELTDAPPAAADASDPYVGHPGTLSTRVCEPS